MKKFLIVFAFCFGVYNWFFYTNPGHFDNPELKQASRASIEEMLSESAFREVPVRSRGRTTHSFSSNWGGICTLSDGGKTILVLSRSFTPPTNTQVECILVPRKVLGIGRHSIIIAALVVYREDGP